MEPAPDGFAYQPAVIGRPAVRPRLFGGALYATSGCATGLWNIRPTIWAIAPSPVILQAVPNESIEIYKAIIRALSASLNPSIELNSPNDAIMAPPGTPGAAIMVMASIATKPANIPALYGIPCNIISARAHDTIFNVDPDM